MLLLLLLLLLPLLMLLPLLQLPPHLFLYLVPFTVSESISYLGKESMISLSLSLLSSHSIFHPFFSIRRKKPFTLTKSDPVT